MAKTAVALSEQGSTEVALNDEFFSQLDAEASGQGEGISRRQEDNILPFLVLLQDMSPEVKQRDPKYIAGAAPGDILNKATGQIWKSGELVVQPVHFSFYHVEWVPRDAGGGYIARYDVRPDDAKEVDDPMDSSGRKKKWIRTSNKNEIIDTRYHVVNIINEDGTIEPAVMSFISTGHTASRQWMTMLGNLRLPSGKAPDSWFRKYRVMTNPTKNSRGEFFKISMQDAGWITDAGIRAAGKALYETVTAGEKQFADEDKSSSASEDVPF